MTKPLSIALLVLTAAAAFSIGRLSLPAQPGFDPARDLNPARLVSQLGLTDAQAGELNQLHEHYTRQVQRACDEHCAARCQLAVALGKDTLGEEQAHQLVEKMCSSQKENELATLRHILKVREVLTPEQRATFAKTLGTCLCSTCQTDGAACCALPPDADASP